MTITAEHLRLALERAYAPPEWYLGFEVGNSTGTNCKRHADAVAINAYPSKGFETRGFEIKVSKSDLKAELNNGLKSDEIAKYCDYWFLVVPKGLADDFTLPPTWGVIEYHDGKLKQKTKASKLEKTSLTAGFMCAMLRGRERLLCEKASKIAADREAYIRRDAEYRAGNAVKDLKLMREKLDEIKKQTGIELNNWTPTDAIISRLNAAQSLDIVRRNTRNIKLLAKELLKDARKIQEAAESIPDNPELLKEGLREGLQEAAQYATP